MRRRYLDWLRGVAVLIMVEAHTIDSWTRTIDRSRKGFAWAQILGGFGAPMFLFLAGVALALAAGSRLRKGLSTEAVAARGRRRGWEIFGLAFLFRFQSWAISGGSFEKSLLRVDILNIMGPAMIVGAVLWGLGRTDRVRALLAASAAVIVTMVTPLIRQSTLVGLLPDPIEWYVRPSPGHTTFTLFPWAGFLLAGVVIGLWLNHAQEPDEERRVNIALGGIGVTMALAGYGASFLPAIYPDTNFWTSSPTFFFLRLGILIATLPAAYAWMRAWRGWSPIEEFGIASLFVYWIHVEMVYGVPSGSIHHRFTLEQWVLAYGVFVTFLFALVKIKQNLVGKNRSEPRKHAQAVPVPQINGL